MEGGYLRPRRRSYSFSSASVAPPCEGGEELEPPGAGLALSDLSNVEKCEPCGPCWFMRNDILVWD